MKKKSPPSHVTFGRIFLVGGILSAVGSALVGYGVLDFMVQREGAWDFQGASGVASVIPGMAGIILAGWAIYHQIRVTSPSYRAAEEVLIEFTNFRRTYSRMVSVIASSMRSLNEQVHERELADATVDTTDAEDFLPEPVSIKSATASRALSAEAALKGARNTRSRRVAAVRVKLQRVAEEMLIDLRHTCSLSGCSACDAQSNVDRSSFAAMSLYLLPLIDTLQSNDAIPKDEQLDIEKVEEAIDVYGSMFDELDEDEAVLVWCNQVVEMIHQIDRTMNALRDRDLLAPHHVERALLHPVQSINLKEAVESTALVRKALAENRVHLQHG